MEKSFAVYVWGDKKIYLLYVQEAKFKKKSSQLPKRISI